MKALLPLVLSIACASSSKFVAHDDTGDVSGGVLGTFEFDLPVPRNLCARRDSNRPRDKIVVHEGDCAGPSLFEIVLTAPHTRPFTFVPGTQFTDARETHRNLRGVTAIDLVARNTATDLVSRDLSFFNTDDMAILNDPAERYRVIHLFYEDLDPDRRKVADDVIDGVEPRRSPMDRMPPRG
jgi:hypothetical protein